MTALIMIGFVVGLIFIAAVAMAMNKHAAEKYGFEPFAFPNLLFVAAPVLRVVGLICFLVLALTYSRGRDF